MVRETRHLWVGNLPENIREERIRELFKRYGRVQSIKLLPRGSSGGGNGNGAGGGGGNEEKTGEVTMACTVAFMDIKSASKAHNAELKIDERHLNTEYYEPAAIPSAAAVAGGTTNAGGTVNNVSPSPPGTAATTSPASRFPNGHGSSDEHGGHLSERFYDRVGGITTVGGGGRGSSSSASSYGDGARRRDRDRTSYRPSATSAGGAGGGAGGVAFVDRHAPTSRGSTGATTPTSWPYDSPRYNSSGAQPDTGYNSTAPDGPTLDRKNSERKKPKSRSGSRSPSHSGSNSSRSPSRSRSRSTSSSSMSSTSRDTSSSMSAAGSGGRSPSVAGGAERGRASRRRRRRRRRARGSSAGGGGGGGGSSRTTNDDRRPLAICVRNLPLRSSDTSLKDGLFHEYKKHGKVTWVKVVGQSAERHAIVCFKKAEDAEKALAVSQDKLFFGCRIEVEPHAGADAADDADLRPYEAELDEYHPKATRTLFIGNLEKDVTASDLRKHFDQFGEIIEIDIKKQGAVSSYAFCQYSDIASVVKAIRKMDGEHLGNNRIKLGFGKSMPYNCVWIDGIHESVNEKYLRMQFEPFGVINRCILDRDRGQALIFYEQVLHAQQAVSKMRGFVLKNSKLQVDFASRECQECFFERLEKSGTVLERGCFEDRRDSSSRSFEASAATRYSSRYDSPSRARTLSYSSRTSASVAAAVQVAGALASPGTPGSLTPRGRSRIARFAYDAYDQPEYCDSRHFRSYDEYSQGSAASHEDPYDHEYVTYAHDSPTHLDPLEVRVIQSIDGVPFAPDIRNLQKERVHLLGKFCEQLEECPSSGDELLSPKKRLKIDLLDPVITSDVIIEANRDHRKVMEIRRLSDAAALRHHSRRPSTDSLKYKDSSGGAGGGHDRSSSYLPHSVGCKRRKTGGSSDGGGTTTNNRHSGKNDVHHQYDHASGSEGGSRPGTPLCDERPEAAPSEPRRTPRDREGPLTLPLPKFAAQVMRSGSVSVAGIKGQKDTTNVLSSPPPVATSPRVLSAQPTKQPPSPSGTVTLVPPPASPPPRPPSASSPGPPSPASTSSSEASTSGGGASAGLGGVSLEERIRSLDEKYEKWSGSRAMGSATTAAGGANDVLASLDSSLERASSQLRPPSFGSRFKFGNKLLNLNLKELQPSEIVKSVLAKRSVFDEDLKRLENVGEKYEPKEFGLFPRTTAATTSGATSGALTNAVSQPTTTTTTMTTPVQLSAPPTLKLVTTVGQCTPMLSPRSSGSTIPAAKGLQYPFPSHPPIQMTATPSVQPTTMLTTVTAPQLPSMASTSASTTVTAPRSTAHSDNRLKPCSSAPSDTRTASKINISVNRTATSQKPCEKVNIPSISDNSNSASGTSDGKYTPAKIRASDKNERIPNRRDSSSSNSPRGDVRSRRNSDTSTRKIDETEKFSEIAEKSLERAKSEERRKEQLEKVRIENERLEREKAEKERIEKEKLEKERQEKERLENERIEKERQQRESELERQRLERERLEREARERERLKREKEQQEKERLEKARQEKEKAEQERMERERIEKEKREQELRAETERIRVKEEKDNKTRDDFKEERLEGDLKERVKEEKERHEREKRGDDHQEKERHEKSDRRRDEDRSRHKDDNHDKKREDHKHRESHSENKHSDKHTHESRNTKDEKSNLHESHKRDYHESKSHEKSRHHSERDSDRRKDSIKENRDNNSHEKHKSITETRHLSIDMDKIKGFETSVKQDPSKRKERNNSLPAGIGNKRRISSHESIDSSDECKRIKLTQEHKKISERRDSKDSTRSEDKSKSSKHKINSIKTHDKGPKEGEEKRKDKARDRDEKHKRHKLEKQKSKSKSREKDSHEEPSTPEFLTKLNLASNEEVEKQRKEGKEKKKDHPSVEVDKRDEKKVEETHKKEKEKERPFNAEPSENLKITEEKKPKKEKCRKSTNTSESDSDEPKKHSIFDIVDDEPAYISMYDKVKARSCKNMQKQEEEKRQEKIKAKFSQLKQSRARREEKKRSTSWDEDSDSEKDDAETKFKRCPKMLIDSSDESQERKADKRRDVYTDSDNSILRQMKSEPAETSEDDFKNKHSTFKGCKSRITSDTSDEEFKLRLHIKKEPEDESEHMAKNEKLTSVKNELQRLIKKERRNSKFLEPEQFGESLTIGSVLSESKMGDFNMQRVYENTSDDDAAEIRKDRSERREKKHKKKQKKQKHSPNGEELNQTESETIQSEFSEKNKHHEKKKDHSKKDKKRDKNREGRDKPKKSKKNKTDSKCDIKHGDGKMENIFGSLSEDSDHASKETVPEPIISTSLNDENAQQPTIYDADSEKEAENYVTEIKELHKRRKEKKKRDKERRLLEAAAELENQSNSNDNSMDFADLGKQLEENIKDDNSDTDVKPEISPEVDNNENTFNFHENDESKKEREHRDGKEKKKKRKKSKDERGKHHHHHHHHDKNKVKQPEIKVECVEPKTEQDKDDTNNRTPTAQSLPSIFDIHSPPETKQSPELLISPSTRETVPIISPLPKTPTTSDKKRESKFLPGFGTEIDEKIHESAVKSISEFDTPVKKEEIKEEIVKDKATDINEEKQRVVISQEETEDAVAALLGESFGGDQFDECYTDDVINSSSEQEPNLTEENNIQDDEEMRQAVQSLSTSELDVKPDTPQSENDLQIDTDTEEQEETSISYEPPPKTQESNACSTEKTSKLYYENREDKSVSTLVICKPNPPSLVPIKTVASPKVIVADEKDKNMPALSENPQACPIITTEKQNPVSEVSVITKEPTPNVTSAPPTSVISVSSPSSVNISSAKPALSTPTLVNYSSLTILSKDSQKTTILEQKIPVLNIAPPVNASQIHCIAARPQTQGATSVPVPTKDINLLSPKAATSFNVNRLPITPVMVSKPLQATAVILPQPKVAQAGEPPKLISSTEGRTQERLKVVFPSNVQGAPYPSFAQNQSKLVLQGHIKNMSPHGLLIPSKNMPPNNYNYMSNVQQTYNVQSVVKDSPQNDLTIKTTQSLPLSNLSVVTMSTSHLKPNTFQNISQSTSPNTPPANSPNSQHSGQASHHSSVTTNPRTFVSAVSPLPKQTLTIQPPSSEPCLTPKPTMLLSPSQKPITKQENTCSNVSSVSSPSQAAVPPKIPSPTGGSPKSIDSSSTLKVTPSENSSANSISEPSEDTKLPIDPIKDEQQPAQEQKPEPKQKLAIEEVTDELNLKLEKQAQDEVKIAKQDIEAKADVTPDTKDGNIIKSDPENETIIKEIDKFDEEKADTESIISDVSKERSASADILAKEDPLGPQEDSDYWSAKEVNIDSVIKTLCSADELSDHSSEMGKDEWGDEDKVVEESSDNIQDNNKNESSTEIIANESHVQDGTEGEDKPKETNINTRSGGRGRGRSARGRRGRTGVPSTTERMQTRRAKLKEPPLSLTTTSKRGRAGRIRTERKSSKESDSAPNDIYEFRDDSDDNNKEQRPRLVLTIKSSSVSNTSNSQTTAIVKEITKDGAKEISKEVTTVLPKEIPATPKPTEPKEGFVSPPGNTRKSRRLLEKDSKNTIDDTIEDVVKNTIQTRSSSNQRRSNRQVLPNKTSPSQSEIPRKSPRGRKPRRPSEALENPLTDDSSKDVPSSSEKDITSPQPPSPAKEPEKAKEQEKEALLPSEKETNLTKEKPKAAMLRRIKGEMASAGAESNEPTNLIDPVTGLLTPMRECEEGEYIPLQGNANITTKTETRTISPMAAKPEELVPHVPEPAKVQTIVISQPQPTPVVQQVPKPQSRKAHVLSSQAAKAFVAQQTPPVQTKPLPPATLFSQQPLSQPPMGMVTKPIIPVSVVSKNQIPISHALNISTSAAVTTVSMAQLSPKPALPAKMQVKPPMVSPSQPVILSASQPKQYTTVPRPQLPPQIPKIMNTAIPPGTAQLVNTQLAHVKQQQQNIVKQQVIVSKGALKHPQHILTGQVASPPLNKAQPGLGVPGGRVIQGPMPASTKGVMEPPKVDVGLPSVMLGRPSLSPQGQARLPGHPVAGYEASLGDAISHFPLRASTDLTPHYMHPSTVMQYQQFLRQQHFQHIQRSSVLDKTGEEGEEAPVASPPLELRRPGSVGLSLTGRPTVPVPHSMLSPHDRTTESPQLSQVYGPLAPPPGARGAPTYHPGPPRYFEPAAEPPPAHQPLTSRPAPPLGAAAAGLGTERAALAHQPPTADRPPAAAHGASVVNHVQPNDRPLSGHVPPLPPAGGGGAIGAGNLMEAIAKYVGNADAPAAAQRGVQAATPPHASQVPPQAESLFMLLKQYPLMWQGLLALKNDQAAVQMYFVSGNDDVAKCSLPKNTDGTTPPLRIFQRMRLEPPQVEGVARKMQMENEHCMLLALPCGHDHMDVLQQSMNLTHGFITYLQQKQAAGIVNVAAPGTTQPPAYVVHIFPSCDFVNENLRRIAPSLLERVADIAHLLIVITTV